MVALTAAEMPPSNEIPAAVTALAAQQATVTSLQGDFRWLTLPADGGEARERRGTFQVMRATVGSAQRFNVTTSDLDGADILRWCSNGTNHWEIEQQVPEEQPTKRKLERGEQRLDLDRIVACLLVDLPTLQRDFFMSIPADEPRRILFVPRHEQLLRDLRQLEVVVVDNQPTSVDISEPDGSRIRLVITKLKRNESIPEICFDPGWVPTP